MVFRKNVKYCVAEVGEYIEDFARELVEYRKSQQLDVVANFRDVLIEVTSSTTEKDIISYYHKCVITTLSLKSKFQAMDYNKR